MNHLRMNYQNALLRVMTNMLLLAVVLLAGAGRGLHAAARQQSAGSSAPVAMAQAKQQHAKILMILNALQSRGKTLRNFQAHLVVQVHHLRTDEKDMNIGHIWYQQKNSTTRFDIRFNMLVVDGAIAKRHADHDIVFDGHWLIDRNGSAKIFRKIEIAPPGKKFNPLRLGQGPLPIPIGQKPADVEREFHVQLLKNKKMPPHTVGLKLIPRDKSAFTFVEVDFWINTRLWLPIKIIRTDPDGTPTTALLSKVVLNKPMRHDFHLSPPGSGWTVVVKHYRGP